jgi:phosphohistidine swiveling domain-containing protein
MQPSPPPPPPPHEAATALLKTRSSVVIGPVIGWLVPVLRRLSRLRENCKCCVVRFIALLRCRLLRIGAALVGRRVLVAAEDVFHLVWADLLRVTTSQADADAAAMATKVSAMSTNTDAADMANAVTVGEGNSRSSEGGGASDDHGNGDSDSDGGGVGGGGGGGGCQTRPVANEALTHFNALVRETVLSNRRLQERRAAADTVAVYIGLNPVVNKVPQPLFEPEGAGESTSTTPPHSLLRGEAVAVGRARGKCYVFGSPAEAAAACQTEPHLRAGRPFVLVAATTDPAWAPFFMQCVAVVTERGSGALSHTAIVARELGIPAVTGVHGATALLHGKHVTVDGTAGEVVISDEHGGGGGVGGCIGDGAVSSAVESEG